MWADLHWLIKDSILNCLHIGMKKKEEIHPERNTCLFVEWWMGWWPVQAEKDCRSFGYSENLLLLVGMEQISKEDIHRLQCLEQCSCGSRVSLLWPDYKYNIFNCTVPCTCTAPLSNDLKELCGAWLSEDIYFTWEQSLEMHPPASQPFLSPFQVQLCLLNCEKQC